MAVVYRHIRLDKNEPFYIGIGKKEKRAYDCTNRNDLWKRVVSKTNYEIDILFNNLSWEEACAKEKEFILLYGRKNLNLGSLCNLTDGGEGAVNFVYTEEMRKAASKRESGKTLSKEHREKISKAHLGKKKTKEHIDKILEAKKNIKLRPRTKEEKLHSSRIQGRKVINIKTKEIFMTLREAAESIGIKTYNLQKKFNGQHKKNNTDLRLL